MGNNYIFLKISKLKFMFVNKSFVLPSPTKLKYSLLIWLNLLFVILETFQEMGNVSK